MSGEHKSDNSSASNILSRQKIILLLLVLILIFALIGNVINNSLECDRKYQDIYDQKPIVSNTNSNNAKIYKKYSSVCSNRWKELFIKSNEKQKIAALEQDFSIANALINSDNITSRTIAKHGWEKGNNLSPTQREELGLTPLMSSLYILSKGEDT